MKQIILWTKGGNAILCHYRYDNFWAVVNGAWDLKLDVDTLDVYILFTEKTVRYDKITFAPDIEGDYNEILYYAENNPSLEFDDVKNYIKNIAKLSKRYPNKFSCDAAVNRDVSGERKVLENNNKKTA